MSRFSPFSDEQESSTSSTNARTGRPTRPPKLLDEIEQISLRQYERVLRKLFSAMDDLFYDLSSRASSNSEANLYFESMRELRVQKEGLTNRALQKLTNSFAALLNEQNQSYAKEDEESALLDRSDLSIVQSDELEVDLAQNNMVNSAVSTHKQELFELTIRLDHLLMQVRVDDDSNPIHPSLISRYFVEACKETLKINIKTKLILFKQFEKHVLKQLGHLYSEANQLLKEAGILPKVPRSLLRSKSAATQQGQGGYIDDDEFDEEANSVDPQMAAGTPLTQTFGILTPAQPAFQMSQIDLHSLLANARIAAPNASQPHAPKGGSTQQPNAPQHLSLTLSAPINAGGYRIYTTNPGPKMTANDLVSYLTQTQANVAQSIPASEPSNVITSLVNDALAKEDPEKPQALDQNNEDVINLVALFFDQVIAENDIPASIQSLICRLQIPVLKVALKDKEFFSDYEHPVRVLINTITELGIGFDNSKPIEKDALYKKIVEIVHTINQEYDTDTNVFIAQQKQLEAAIKREVRKAEAVEKRTKQAEIGKAKLTQAKQLAQDAIYQKIKDIQLPATISNFLSSSWLQVLMIVQLRNGVESNEWVAMEQVVTDIVWLCQPHADPRSQMRRERLLPSLLDQVEDALETAIDNENARRTIVDGLEETIRAIFENQVTKEEFTELQPEQKEELGRGEGDQKPWDELTAVEKQQLRYEELSKQFFEVAKNLPENTWVDYRDADDETKMMRCKLAAKVNSDTYIFVNRLGFKVFNKTRKEFAYDMQFNRARIVDSSPLFDRLMQRIVDGLSSSPAPAS